jgi:hypothetical protein
MADSHTVLLVIFAGTSQHALGGRQTNMFGMIFADIGFEHRQRFRFFALGQQSFRAKQAGIGDRRFDFGRRRLRVTERLRGVRIANVTQRKCRRSSNGRIGIGEQPGQRGESVLNDKAPLTTGQEGLQDLKIMMAAYEPVQTGKAVKIG